MPESDEDFNEPVELVSKSQLRRDALEVKSLAGRLIALSPSVLASLPLEEPVRAAIDEARRIRSNVARKRQLQFVAKLLRRDDPEPIAAALAALDDGARQLGARQHRCEAWRDRLLESGDRALGELLRTRPDADAPALRQCMRQARKEAERGRPPSGARTLFRLLREMDESEALPPLRS